MHFKFGFFITFAIDVSFIRPILYLNRDFFRIVLVYLLKKYLLNHNLQKNKFQKITFTNLLKNAAEHYYYISAFLSSFVANIKSQQADFISQRTKTQTEFNFKGNLNTKKSLFSKATLRELTK